MTAAWYAAGDGGRWELARRLPSPDRVERLRDLLDAGLDPSEGASRGCSLITEACRAGDPARVALLLARGARAVPQVDPERIKKLAEERAAWQRHIFARGGASEERIEADLKMYFPETKGQLSASEIGVMSLFLQKYTISHSALL